MADSEMDQSILIKFAQKLAGNEKKYRDLAMKKLRKWLSSKSQSSNDGISRMDFIKIWKGLHYCMWMSDKPLVQEELASSIAGLIKCFQTFEQSMLFVDTFYETECREWYGIDRLRLDKFMMLIRQVFRHALALIKSHKWKKSQIRKLVKVLQRTIITSDLSGSTPEGLRYHMADIYLDELDRADTEMSTERVHMFLEPYCIILTKMKIDQLFHHIVNRIFLEMVQWEVEKSDILWRNEERKEFGEEEEEEEIPEHIKVDYTKLADHLFELASKKKCSSKNRPHIYSVVKKLRDISEGILPQRLTYDDVGPVDVTRKEIKQAAQEMMEFELKLEKSTNKAHAKRLKKQKRKQAAKLEKRNLDEATEPRAKKAKLSSDQESSPNSDKENEKKSRKIDKKMPIQKNMDKKIADSGKKSKHKIVVNTDQSHDAEESSEKQKTVKRKRLSNETEPEEILEMEKQFHLKEKSPSRKQKKKQKRDSNSEAVLDNSENNTEKESTVNSLSRVPVHELLMEPRQTPKEKKKHKRNSAIGMSLDGMDNGLDVQIDNYKKETKNKRRKSLADLDDVKELSGKLEDELSAVSQNHITNAPKPVNTDASPKLHKNKQKDLSNSMKGKNKAKLNASSVKLDREEKLLFQGGFESDSDDDNLSKDPPKKKGVSLTTPVTKSAGKAKRRQSEGDLVTFSKVTKTPPAFVKRAFRKLSTPCTEPKKSSARLTTMDEPGSLSSLSKKKVIFDMKKNQAQDFNESLQVSPMVPFDPQQKPEVGILRTPVPNDSTPIHTPRAKLFKRRSKAVDFFTDV